MRRMFTGIVAVVLACVLVWFVTLRHTEHTKDETPSEQRRVAATAAKSPLKSPQKDLAAPGPLLALNKPPNAAAQHPAHDRQRPLIRSQSVERDAAVQQRSRRRPRASSVVPSPKTDSSPAPTRQNRNANRDYATQVWLDVRARERSPAGTRSRCRTTPEPIYPSQAGAALTHEFVCRLADQPDVIGTVAMLDGVNGRHLSEGLGGDSSVFVSLGMSF